MFRFLGYILASVAKALDVASTAFDIVLTPAPSYDDSRNFTVPLHDSTAHSGSRHDNGSGRVMSKEDFRSSGAGGSGNTQHGFEASREFFDSQHGLSDGYHNQAEHMRTDEFKRLGSRVYVDHAGAALYSEKQLEHAYKDLKEKLYTNPHSGHAAWGDDIHAMECEAEARARTLAMCKASAEDYECIFTSGATGAMRLVAEAFPWSEGSTFAYTLDNHNSIVGMRGYALEQQASAVAVHITSHDPAGPLRLEPCAPAMHQHSCSSGPPSTESSASQHIGAVHSLFAYPLESNFSGVRYGLQPTTQLQQHGMELPVGHSMHSGHHGSKAHWHVFLDAAKACGSSPPDLGQAPADFVALSYYKIFGYPTGLGALLVRKDALSCLRKRYFGGGAVSVSVADRDFFRQRRGAAGFEDGTPAYLGIAALKHGFAAIEAFGSFAAIERHTASLTRYLATALANLRHADGSAVCELYGAHRMASGAGVLRQSKQHGDRGCLPGAVSQGPIVAFNLFRTCGAYVGYREVEKVAGLAGVMLRTGCFCNPGACQAHLGLSYVDVIRNYEAGHVCWDDQDIINGGPTGAVRASFGYMSTFSDAHAVVRFVEQYFVVGPSLHQPAEPVLGDCAAASLPNGAVSHQRKPQGAVPSAEDSTSESTSAGNLLGSHPSLPKSNGHPDSDAKKAVLDQGHHRGGKGSAASFGTASKDSASLPNVCLGTGTSAVSVPDLAQAARPEGPVRLERIWVYPIKSCAGFAPSSWPLGVNGLLYDREWAIVDVEGEALTQKRLPKLATIKPVLDLAIGVMRVSCPSMPKPISIALSGAASAASLPGSVCHRAGAAVLGTGPAAQDTQRMAKSLPASLQPTPLKAPGRARPGSSGPARSDVQDSDVDSIAGSAVSQSDSFISEGSRHHLNPAMWPGRDFLEQRRSGSSFLQAGSSQAPMSRSSSAADHGRLGMGSLDVKSVRDRFRHMHSSASLGGASQQSMPSRASIDAYSPLGASQQSTSKPVPHMEMHPKYSQNRQLPQPQGTSASEASILQDFRAHREGLADASPRHEQNRQLPQSQVSPVSEASVLRDFRQHREAVQARKGSSSGQPALAVQAPEQDAHGGRKAGQEEAALQAEGHGGSAVAAKGIARLCDDSPLQRQIQVCSSHVCGLQVGTQEVQEAVSEWFTSALGIKCWLVRQQAGSRQAADREQLATGAASLASTLLDSSEASLDAVQRRSIGFANEGQILAISSASLQDVNKRVQETAAAKNREPVQVSPERFRPNLVFSNALQPYVEDTWQHLSINNVPFRVAGPCARCEMVCTDQEAGKRGGPEPLLTLAAYRRTRGRIHFGVLLDHALAADSLEVLQLGAAVTVQ